jgi:hypothetical protein
VGFGNAFDGTKGRDGLAGGVEASESFAPELARIGHNNILGEEKNPPRIQNPSTHRLHRACTHKRINTLKS